MSELFKPGDVAVVTGAALGIGAAAALRFASLGMHVVMIDLPSTDFDAQADKVKHAGAAGVHPLRISVSDRDALMVAASEIGEHLGAPSILMNNAVTRIGGKLLESTADWHAAFEVNFWGVVNGVDTFAPAMRLAGRRAYIVNVGSKQGITNPPGNAIYNIAKSALKTYTELLQHELRQAQPALVSAHLLVPGFTTTGKRAHDPGAWLPTQVVDRMFAHLARDSFYIVCPDNEVSEAMDRKRIAWAAGDITEDRPPLSRWSGQFEEEFGRFEL